MIDPKPVWAAALCAVLAAPALAQTPPQLTPEQELIAALGDHCLPLFETGTFNRAGLTKLPSFMAKTFVGALDLSGDLYRFGGVGEASIILPEHGSVCHIYQMADDYASLLAALGSWLPGSGFEGTLPEVAAAETTSVLTSATATIEVTVIPERLAILLHIKPVE